MLTNKIIHVVTGLTGIVLLPIVPISTLVFGFLISITFGLLAIPITLVWCCFYFPLLALSFIWEKYKILRPIAAIIGIPIAIIAEIFVSLMPSMGEMDAKMAKWLNTLSFPYNWTLFQLERNSAYPITSGNYRKLLDIFYRVKTNNKYMTAYIDKEFLEK